MKHKRRVIVISSCDSLFFYILSRGELQKQRNVLSKMNDSITIVVRVDISNISRSRFPLSRITGHPRKPIYLFVDRFELRKAVLLSFDRRDKGTGAALRKSSSYQLQNGFKMPRATSFPRFSRKQFPFHREISGKLCGEYSALDEIAVNTKNKE